MPNTNHLIYLAAAIPFISVKTNVLICFQHLEQNFRFKSKLPDMHSVQAC